MLESILGSPYLGRLPYYLVSACPASEKATQTDAACCRRSLSGVNEEQGKVYPHIISIE